MYKLGSQPGFKRGIFDLYSCTILTYVNQKRKSHTIVSALSVKNRLQRLQCNTHSKHNTHWTLLYKLIMRPMLKEGDILRCMLQLTVCLRHIYTVVS